MTEFTIGDRVRPIGHYESHGAGTVVMVDDDIILVEHDNRFKRGHNGNRLDRQFKAGQCWWYPDRDLVLVELVALAADYGDDIESDIEELM